MSTPIWEKFYFTEKVESDLTTAETHAIVLQELRQMEQKLSELADLVNSNDDLCDLSGSLYNFSRTIGVWANNFEEI